MVTSNLSCIASILFAHVNSTHINARKNYATLEINPKGVNLRPDDLDWIVRYQIGFFYSSSQCEQVCSHRS